MKIFTFLRTLFIALLLTAAGINVHGQLIWADSFEYEAGTQLTANGWSAHSGGTTNPFIISEGALDYLNYEPSGVGNKVAFRTSGQDINRSFPGVTTGTVYAAFMINVSAAQGGDYFAHFIGHSTTIFSGRVFAKSISTGFQLGISKSTGTATYVDHVLDFNVTHLVVLKHEIVEGADNNIVSIFVNPVVGSPEPEDADEIISNGTDPEFLSGFALRQGSAGNSATLTLDGIRIATTWDEAVKYFFDTNPSIVIDSPENRSTVYEDEVEIQFTVNNFIINGEGAQGEVAYRLGDGPYSYTDQNTVTITGLAEGENVIRFLLVDTERAPLDPEVSETLTVIYEIPVTDPVLTITSPEDGVVIYIPELEIVLEVENFVPGTDGRIKYTLDNGTPQFTTETTINLTALTLGEHVIDIELVDMLNASLAEPVIRTLAFTYNEPTTYTLVTSAQDLISGDKYLFVGVKNSDNYALGWQKSGSRHAVPVEVTGNSITAIPATTVSQQQDYEHVYEILLGGTDGAWTLYDVANEKYLTPRTGENNGLVITDIATNWNIIIGEDNLASAVSTGNEQGTVFPRNILRFNPNGTSDPIFSCYNNTNQEGFYLYRFPFSTDPVLTITSPEDNSTVDENVIDINFEVRNFTLGTDGKVKFSLNNSFVSFVTESPVTNVTLSEGVNTISLELVNTDETSLDPPVVETINITYEVPVIEQPTLTITNPEQNSTIYSQDVAIEFNVENFVIGEQDGKIKYTLDQETPVTVSSTNPINLTGLSSGLHTVTLELISSEGNSLDPAVTASVTFTIAQQPSGGMETFTNSTTTNNYGSGSYVGDNGITWSYGQARSEMEFGINGKGMMLRRGSDSYVQSQTLSGGIGMFEVKMRKAHTGAANRQLELYINDELKDVSEIFGSTSGADATIRTFSVEVNHPGDFVLKIKPSGNTDGNQQIVIDDISWTSYTGTDPSLTITSPENGSEVNTNSIDIDFTVENFVLGTDGRVKLTVNSDTSVYFTESPITGINLEEGENTINLELVDMMNAPLDPAVSRTITVSYVIPGPQITITSPTQDQQINTRNVDIEFTVADYEIGEAAGKIKYTVDELSPVIIATTTPISLTDLTYGQHTVTLELVDNGGNSLDPARTASVTFTVVEPMSGGMETFTNSTAGNGYGDGSYVGDNGLTWTYNHSRDEYNFGINEKGLMLRRGSDSYVQSQVLSGGIGTFEVKMRKAYTSENVRQLELYINDNLVGLSETFGYHNTDIDDTIRTFTVDIFHPGDFVMKIKPAGNSTDNQQITIDDISWTGFAVTEPYINITSPANNSVVTTDNVDVEFQVLNFNLGTDGRVKFTVNQSAPEYITESPVTNISLEEGSNTITLELVDMEGASLTPAVERSITVIYNAPVPAITITDPSSGSVLFSRDVDIVFEVENFEIGASAGKIKYTVDEEAPVIVSVTTPISLTALSYGEHTVTLELVDNGGNSLDPAVTTNVIFTVSETMLGGMETFTNSDATESYANSSYIGDNGLTWTYNHSRDEADFGINGKGIMLRRGSDSYVQSQTISGGIGTFEVKMRKAHSGATARQLELYINDQYIASSKIFGNFNADDDSVHVFSVDVYQEGNFVMKIKPAGETTRNQQVVIDDISWTGYDGTSPFITITSPANNTTVNQDQVSVEFEVFNFEIGENDGKVEYRLNGNSLGTTLESPLTITGLTEGENLITLELVDNTNQPLDPAVRKSITVNYVVPGQPALTIISPEQGAIISSNNVSVQFTVENFEIGASAGKIKYTLDAGNPQLHSTLSPIELTTLDNGQHTVVLELVDVQGNSLTPPVTASVTFTVRGINVESNLADIVSVYPNPAVDFINIELPEGIDNLSITNIAGQTVMDIKPVEGIQRINIGELNTGVYFIKVTKTNISETFKIIVK